MHTGIFSLCVCMYHVSAASMGTKRGSQTPWNWTCQMDVSHHVGAENRTSVICENSQDF